ncbi:glycosyltransferase [Zhenpiania hominis]|uniref:glycosyltransferase n=1 Tax=Zhenpiania hominis TaxID=2763644 RepID=UPI0039F4E85D
MIKVCHVTSAHKNDDVRIFVKECRTLACCGEYEVYLVAEGEANLIKDRVNIVASGLKPVQKFKRLFFFSKKIYKTAINVDADIYHLHDPELLLYALKLKRKGKKVIFDSHEDYYEQIQQKKYIYAPLRKMIAVVYRLFETYICKRIDAVIFPCLKDGKHPFEGRCKKLECINNTPVLSEFYDQYSETSLNEEGFNVCYTGSITYNRGISYLIEACYHSNVKLILAGNFESEAYENELRGKKEFECVDYRGVCSREEILNIYRETSAGANTLLNVGQYAILDNLSTKVYEYMAMGIPVIISKTSYNQHLMEECRFGLLVDPYSVTEISEAIDFLKSNRIEAEHMGQRGRDLVKEQFNWEIEERKLLRLYMDVIFGK